jgi:hypothetical protein
LRFPGLSPLQAISRNALNTEFPMNQTKASLKFLISLAVVAGTTLLAGCGSDEKVTKTTTTEQSTTTVPMVVPTTSTTTTTTTQQSEH